MTNSKGVRVALYLRCSTSEQDTTNQRRELEQVAARHGWTVAKVFEDAGISGAKGRDKRPGLDGLLKLASRREIDMVAAWSVDRLGRSLADLCSLLTDLHEKKVELYLHQQGLDTTTSGGKAMFQMFGVFSEFEHTIIRERVRAGMARAKAQGKTFGRPRVSAAVEAQIRAMLKQGVGMVKIGRQLGCGTATVQRIRNQANAT